MAAKGHNIIVIGTSAGGLEALDALVSELPTDLPSAIFVVQHIAPENTGVALLHVPKPPYRPNIPAAYYGAITSSRPWTMAHLSGDGCGGLVDHAHGSQQVRN